jgi:hypothetical protein
MPLSQWQWPAPYHTIDRLYGNLDQREMWLDRLETLARNSGWIARPSCSFSPFDLEILGPGPVKLQLQSVYEENLERGQHYVRYQIRARFKASALVWLGLAGASLLASAWAHLWPMLFPLGLSLMILARAPSTMRRAVSQLAVEAGEALGMPLVRQVDS